MEEGQAMRGLLTSGVIAGSGMTQLFKYEMDALRTIADVQIVHVADVDEGGVTERCYTVHYVVHHPAVHPYLPRSRPTVTDGDKPVL